jgi:hypothetical protein
MRDAMGALYDVLEREVVPQFYAPRCVRHARAPGSRACARAYAYWRAANYLSVGQIYLYDNPLLKRPLALDGHQAHAAGPLGHDAGPELHLRAPEPRSSRSTTST